MPTLGAPQVQSHVHQFLMVLHHLTPLQITQTIFLTTPVIQVIPSHLRSIVWVLQVRIQTLSVSVLNSLDHISHRKLVMIVPLEKPLALILQTEIRFMKMIATGMYLNMRIKYNDNIDLKKLIYLLNTVQGSGGVRKSNIGLINFKFMKYLCPHHIRI